MVDGYCLALLSRRFLNSTMSSLITAAVFGVVPDVSYTTG
jgi:hypothetical protein